MYPSGLAEDWPNIGPIVELGGKEHKRNAQAAPSKRGSRVICDVIDPSAYSYNRKEEIVWNQTVTLQLHFSLYDEKLILPL